MIINNICFKNPVAKVLQKCCKTVDKIDPKFFKCPEFATEQHVATKVQHSIC